MILLGRSVHQDPLRTRTPEDHSSFCSTSCGEWMAPESSKQTGKFPLGICRICLFSDLLERKGAILLGRCMTAERGCYPLLASVEASASFAIQRDTEGACMTAAGPLCLFWWKFCTCQGTPHISAHQEFCSGHAVLMRATSFACPLLCIQEGTGAGMAPVVYLLPQRVVATGCTLGSAMSSQNQGGGTL